MRYILIIMYVLNLLCAQSNAPKEAPLNPDFIKYIEDKQIGLIHNINSEGYSNSVIPHPTDHKIEIPKSYKVSTTLFDKKYDLRSEDLVTPVQNQGQCGSCWIFATIGSIESFWKKLGLGTYDLSENNAATENGFEGDPCEGGNAKQLTPYLIRGDGPVSEADDPYVLGKVHYNPMSDPQGIITETRFIPNDIDAIKDCINKYGGLYSSFSWFGEFFDYYDNANDTYFYSSDPQDTTDAGHAIVLVGWDDDMQTVGGTGAWIIKNSWGTGFGENGYFYIAYQDSFINADIVASWPGRRNYNEHSTIYYYDKLGFITNWGYDPSEVAFALVKYTIQNNETLYKVGTYTVRGNAQVSFDIWDDFNDVTLTLSSPLGNTSLNNVNDCEFPGYYTYDIPTPIEVTVGDDVYIRVKYQTSGWGYPIPAETYVEDYANPQIESNCFWISSNGNNGNWSQFGDTTDDYKDDPCIKLYTTETGQATSWLDVKNDITIPTEFKLSQNYPNPFNPTTSIVYEIQHESNVKLVIYDLVGNKIRTLVNDYKQVGQHTISWDGRDNLGQAVSGGIYFCKLQAGDFIQTRKMLLLK